MVEAVTHNYKYVSFYYYFKSILNPVLYLTLVFICVLPCWSSDSRPTEKWGWRSILHVAYWFYSCALKTVRFNRANFLGYVNHYLQQIWLATTQKMAVI